MEWRTAACNAFQIRHKGRASEMKVCNLYDTDGEDSDTTVHMGSAGYDVVRWWVEGAYGGFCSKAQVV